jgi:ribonucleoside-diphosphate reductase alpha chain
LKSNRFPSLCRNAVEVLKRRYLLRDDRGNVAETPKQLFLRVAESVAKAELIYDKSADLDTFANSFYEIMGRLLFLPNSPTLMNAGTRLGQLSACFVLPLSDSMRGIFQAVEYMSLIQQSGGGTGFSFSNLRPRGDLVKTTMGIASGPVSFMRVFDITTEVIKQGGKRRGANMGILSVNHPDILEFVTAKIDGVSLKNFNISVAITDDFMKKVEEDDELSLVNPRTHETMKRVSALGVFRSIAQCAWKSGDPGVVFMDRINEFNPTPQLGRIESTNPCGEQPLLPFESCNLGSIDVSKFVSNDEVDWEALKGTVRLSVRFLDDVIDVNKYPIREVLETTKANRKIGLGIMGFADLLCKLSIPYDSREAIAEAETIMSFLSIEARKTSEEIAKIKGSFPSFNGSIWDTRGYKRMRNATLTTIAPTGTISIIAGCSSGIEPLFAVAFIRNVLNGTKMLESNAVFTETARARGFLSDNLLTEISRRGSIQKVSSIPRSVRRIFVTSHDIHPNWHVKMQAAFQRYCDNAVSKTVNLPNDATVEDVEDVFSLAYKLGCKGITVYRYGSKKDQVMQFASESTGDCTRECAF